MLNPFSLNIYSHVKLFFYIFKHMDIYYQF